MDLIRGYVPSGSQILELGSGVGIGASLLVETGYRVIATDISHLFLLSAKQADPDPPCAVADLYSLPFSTSTFDAVVCNETIEHIPSVEAALDEMIRVTQSGGFIICKSPALASPIWPVMDLGDLVIRKQGRPPHYRNLREAAGFFFRNLGRTVQIALEREPVFHKREPTLSDDDGRVGGDTDACYWSSASEVSRYLSNRGFIIHKRVDHGPRYSRSWIVAKTAPFLSPTMAVVAEKKR